MTRGAAGAGKPVLRGEIHVDTVTGVAHPVFQGLDAQGYNNS